MQCTQCPRLSDFLHSVRSKYPDYHAQPVVAFGDDHPKILIVGLAPGMHGANRTGRPFTGDHAGILLYQTLYKFGFATKPESIAADDELQLIGCRITNAVKCLPPENKPLPQEIRQCNQYLKNELNEFINQEGKAIVALGLVAHQAILKGLQLSAKSYLFGHGNIHTLPTENTVKLYDSYHCSRYNTQTKRLTCEMFEQVFAKIASEL
ncbi:MAG: uracil-DNA glycosylase [Nitrosomonas sp.]|nr:uracil-DNA glycosylase [Nitrosomonas sp.]